MNKNERDAPDEQDRYFETTDFDLSVALMCKNYVLESIENDSGSKLIFVFQRDEDLEDIVNGYWSSKILVSPLDFANARKNLKSRIYGLKKNY